MWGMKKSRKRKVGPRQTSFSLTPIAPRTKWTEMSQEERVAWIEQKRTWLTEKRRREQEYLDRRGSDLTTDRDYRADATHEVDLLAMLAELAEDPGSRSKTDE